MLSLYFRYVVLYVCVVDGWMEISKRNERHAGNKRQIPFQNNWLTIYSYGTTFITVCCCLLALSDQIHQPNEI